MRIFPWESRAKRRANIDHARRRAEDARRGAERSQQLSRDLLDRAEDNHFFQAIYEAVAGSTGEGE